MTNADNQNDPNIRIVISVRNDNIGIIGITMIPRKKNRRRRNTEVIVVTIRTTISGQETSVAALVDLPGKIDNIGTNEGTRKAETMTSIGNHEGTKPRHGIADD